MLTGFVKKSGGTQRICSDALMVSLTGMHSCIKPTTRLHWKKRLALIFYLSEQSLMNTTISLCSNPNAFKELIRRFLCNTVSSDFASNYALKYFGHPIWHMAGNQGLCPNGIEISSTAFVNAGKNILELKGCITIYEAIHNCFKKNVVNNVRNRAPRSRVYIGTLHGTFDGNIINLRILVTHY